MPWLEELFPPEDSLDLLERRGRKAGAELTIAVLRLPSLSNFSDLDPLEAEPSVQLRWIRPGEPLGRPDALILPGSKQTLRDLAALQASGLAGELRQYLKEGGHVFGLCGGLQMLGRRLDDPERLEGGAATAAGLDLLPLSTGYGGAKALRQRRSQALWPAGEPLEIEGFELHRGQSQALAGGSLQPLAAAGELGWWSPGPAGGDGGGVVAGSYLHGLFESGPWRRRWLNQLRRRRRLPPLPEVVPHHGRQREALLERLADAFESHVNLTPLLGDG
jgi:adenosylcobyric acid synthase